MTFHQVDRLPESLRHGGSEGPESCTCTAALERALHVTLLALVSLSQHRNALNERLNAVRQWAAQPDDSLQAVEQIRQVLNDLSGPGDATAEGIA